MPLLPVQLVHTAVHRSQKVVNSAVRAAASCLKTKIYSHICRLISAYKSPVLCHPICKKNHNGMERG